MHSLWARKTESFRGIDFSYSIGRNADPLSMNQITSRRSCDLIGRAILAAILAGFSDSLIIRRSAVAASNSINEAETGTEVVSLWDLCDSSADLPGRCAVKIVECD